VFALPTSDGGDPQLRETLALFFNNYFQPVHAVRAAHIVLTAGASDGTENLIHAICDDGDSVLVPGPLWRKSRNLSMKHHLR
jgi:aspartate/methionine/tyrosine aminotransferase